MLCARLLLWAAVWLTFSKSEAISFSFGKIFSPKTLSVPKLSMPKPVLGSEMSRIRSSLMHERPPPYNPYFSRAPYQSQLDDLPSPYSFQNFRSFPPPYSKHTPTPMNDLPPRYSSLYPSETYSRIIANLGGDEFARPPPYNPSFMNEAHLYSKTAPTFNTGGIKPKIDSTNSKASSGHNGPAFIPPHNHPGRRGFGSFTLPGGLGEVGQLVPVPLPIPHPPSVGYSSIMPQENSANIAEPPHANSDEDSLETERPRLMAIESGEIEGVVQIPAATKLHPWTVFVRKNSEEGLLGNAED